MVSAILLPEVAVSTIVPAVVLSTIDPAGLVVCTILRSLKFKAGPDGAEATAGICEAGPDGPEATAGICEVRPGDPEPSAGENEAGPEERATAGMRASKPSGAPSPFEFCGLGISSARA